MNAPTRTVVAGIDGRPATLRAALWAAREADRRGVPLLLVAAADAGGASRTAQADLDQARRVVSSLVEVPTGEVILGGPAGPALATVSHGAELLVLGARTPDGRTDESVGEPTAHLLTRAECPVVVVPAAWDPERRHEGEVVVAADPADPHAAARGPVALATEVAARWGVPLLAVVVLPREPGHREVARGRRLLDGILGDVEAGRCVPVIDEVVRHGDPARALLDLVGPPSGLLVLGARGAAEPAPSADAGPTCRQVVRWARCPVGVVPPGVPGVRRPNDRPVLTGGTR
jgi:nucleotide-binding universal stress UspA family protein